MQNESGAILSRMHVTSDPAITVGVVSGDPCRRQHLRRLLPHVSEISEAETCAEARALIASQSLSCFVMDLPIGDCAGIHLVQELEGSESAVVVVTAPEGIALAAEALKSGAQDYLLGSNLVAAAVQEAVLDAIDKKRQQHTRAVAEKRYRDIFEDASVMHVVARSENDTPVIVDCNNVFLNTLEYPRDEVLGRPLLDFFERRWLDRNEEARVQFLEPDGMLEECTLAGRGGRVIHAVVHVAPDCAGATESAQGVRATLVNITKRVDAEKALEQSEARTRAVLDALPDTLLRIDIRDGGLRFSSARETTALEDESERPIEYAHRDLPHEVERQFKRYLDIAGITHRAAAFEYPLDIQGQSRTLEARLVAIGGDEALAIIRDLTAQKDLERQLAQSQRLEAVGRLAGGVAHDFNNILTVISGYAELCLTDARTADEIDAESVREILDASRRATDLTRQLLAFSRKQVLQPRSLDLNQLVSDLEKMLRRMIGEDVRISKELDPDLGMIKADPGQIEQILMNLAVNARDAMPDGGHLSFCTENCVFYETYVGEETKIPSGSYVRLTVSDDGDGMDGETRSHIFEPFFTTKDKGRGTGLGLSTVYGIVKQSGGYIFVYSESGEGTVFKMYFPRHDAQEAEEPVTTEPANVGGNETILLVEDDVPVLAFAATILEREGYKVIRARSGDEALAVVRDYPDDIHLVATDVVMPGISGPELAASLTPLGQDIKVLYMSGYTDDAVGRQALLSPGTRFLEKPYTRQPLLRAIRQALDSTW